MTSISKNVYIDKLYDIVNKCNNNTYYKTTKMKPVAVQSSTYINSREINDEESKFKIGDIIKISRYKNTFGKYSVLSFSEKVFVI